MTTGTITPELAAGAVLLERAAESVRAVIHSEDNRFTRAFAALNSLSTSEGIPIAVIGGLAAIRYGYPAVTEDIDIVVARDHLERLLDESPRFGFKVQWRSRSGWHTLRFEDVEINVVPEGGKARDTAPTTIPGPPALGVTQGLDYANLPGWIELKLSSGRTKDRTHIVEVIKTLSPEQLTETVAHIRGVAESYAVLLDQLIVEAAEEVRQESERDQRNA